MAGAITSASDFVPYCDSASAAASTTAGTVAPSGPLPGGAGCPVKSAGIASFGAGPWPLMTTTFRSRADAMMIGLSPPRPKCEISTTAAAKIDATPASIALPPSSISRAPASTVKLRPAATTAREPVNSGRSGGAASTPMNETAAHAHAHAAARARRIAIGIGEATSCR